MLMLRDAYALLRALWKWGILGGLVGVLSGSAAAIFLIALDAVTRLRLDNPWLIAGLPLMGLAIGYVYWRYGDAAARGNALILENVHVPQRIPRRIVPLILLGTLASHLVGGSVGREGTGVQMGVGLAEAVRRLLESSGAGLRRLLGWREGDARLLLMAGISGGFGGVFGTPIAGMVFALEVPSIGRVRFDGALPCLIAALVADLTSLAWGAPHAHYPALHSPDLLPLPLLRVALLGLACGLVSLAFIETTEAIKRQMARRLAWPPLRPALGGLIVLALLLLLGLEYGGLSTSLIDHALHGEFVAPLAFLAKLLLTAATLGVGFVGGEVTPLFVMGATLGASLGPTLGLEAVFAAQMGFIAVFAAASNTPLASVLMGVELFGSDTHGLAYWLVVVLLAYLVSGHRSIYATQRIRYAKGGHPDLVQDETVHERQARRSGTV